MSAPNTTIVTPDISLKKIVPTLSKNSKLQVQAIIAFLQSLDIIKVPKHIQKIRKIKPSKQAKMLEPNHIPEFYFHFFILLFFFHRFVLF